MKHLLNNLTEEDKYKILKMHSKFKPTLNEDEYEYNEDVYNQLIKFANSFKILHDLIDNNNLQISKETYDSMIEFMKQLQNEMRNLNPKDEKNFDFSYFWSGTEVNKNLSLYNRNNS
jgi:hypothetical protein